MSNFIGTSKIPFIEVVIMFFFKPYKLCARSLINFFVFYAVQCFILAVGISISSQNVKNLGTTRNTIKHGDFLYSMLN